MPNYFGAQRFGIEGSNLEQARHWTTVMSLPGIRNKRSFALSAARSALFNQIVSERLKKTDFNQVIIGDALQLAGRGNWFVAKADEFDALQPRVWTGRVMDNSRVTRRGRVGLLRGMCWRLNKRPLPMSPNYRLTGARTRYARRAMLLFSSEFRVELVGRHDCSTDILASCGKFRDQCGKGINQYR